MKYAVHIVIVLLYVVLFLVSGGLFHRTAEFLLGKIKGLRAVTDSSALSRALMIFLGAALLSAAMTARGDLEDTAREGYLTREEYGGADEEKAVVLSTEESSQEITVSVEARKLSAGEIRRHLEEAGKELNRAVFPDGVRPEHVDEDLRLPDTVKGHPVRVSWMTDLPEILDFEGHNLLMTGSSKDAGEGIPVILTAEIICEDVSAEKVFPVTVYPKKMTDAERMAYMAAEAVRETNDASEEKVRLPEQVGGRAVSWKTPDDGSGLLLLFLGILTAVFYVYADAVKKDTEEQKRIEQMKQDYPGIISKLVLLVSAGMSLRSAFYRIGRDYRTGLLQGGAQRAGYEEIVAMTKEMEHGIPEAEAYGNLGKRVRCPVYKTFSTLLVQNLMRGGSDMAGLLMREADEAFDERKKRARVLGEEAGTKLLLPMMLMLCIVMAILIVPAFFAFA